LHRSRVGESFGPHLVELPPQHVAVDVLLIPESHETQDRIRIGAKQAGGVEAAFADVGRLSHDVQFLHPVARGQTMRDGAQQRAVLPGVSRQATQAQVLQQDQKIQVLKVAEDGLNGRRDGHCHTPLVGRTAQ
jgi:hypothetical protein